MKRSKATSRRMQPSFRIWHRGSFTQSYRTSSTRRNRRGRLSFVWRESNAAMDGGLTILLHLIGAAAAGLDCIAAAHPYCAVLSSLRFAVWRRPTLKSARRWIRNILRTCRASKITTSQTSSAQWGVSKPGFVRLLTTSACFQNCELWRAAYYATRPVSVASARSTSRAGCLWPARERMVFFSNYDGSVESYMDDFINKTGFGLNASFSNGIGYPRTNWLVLDGCDDERKLLRNTSAAIRLPTQVWA